MARANQRSPKRNTTLLDIQRRINSGKWTTSEIHKNHHPKSDERLVPEWAAHRTPWYHQRHWTGKTDNVLARHKQWYWAIHGDLPALPEIAASNKKHPEKKNQLGQEIPVMPWTKLGTDIFTLDGVNYLLVVNYTSKFPIMWKLTSMTGKAVANHFKNLMSEYGLALLCQIMARATSQRNFMS